MIESEVLPDHHDLRTIVFETKNEKKSGLLATRSPTNMQFWISPQIFQINLPTTEVSKISSKVYINF